jgi:hypothetical protein
LYVIVEWQIIAFLSFLQLLKLPGVQLPRDGIAMPATVGSRSAAENNIGVGFMLVAKGIILNF